MAKRLKLLARATHAVECTKNSPFFSNHFPHADADYQRLAEINETYRGVADDKLPLFIRQELQVMINRSIAISWHT